MSIRAELPVFTPYTFGTMSLGKRVADFDRDLKLARTAMEAGVWFHTSQEYAAGDTFMILRQAFEQAPHQVPSTIFKIRCDRAETIRFDVEDALRRLNLSRVDVAQLCRDTHDHRAIVDDFLQQGPMYETCCELRKQGMVGNFIFEVFPGYAHDALEAVQHDLFDACIFYYNPAQRHAPPAVWQAMRDHETPMLALRTLGKISAPPAETAAHLEENGKREAAAKLRQLQPIFEASACASWPTFCVRFALSVPGVRTTIGGTASLAQLSGAAQRSDEL